MTEIEIIDQVKKLNEYRKLNYSDVINRACDYFEIHPKKLFNKERYRNLCEIRAMIFSMLKYDVDINMTYTDIGKMLNKDRTTVMHSISSLQKWIEVYPELNDKLKDLYCYVYGNSVKYFQFINRRFE